MSTAARASRRRPAKTGSARCAASGWRTTADAPGRSRRALASSAVQVSRHRTAIANSARCAAGRWRPTPTKASPSRAGAVAKPAERSSRPAASCGSARRSAVRPMPENLIRASPAASPTAPSRLSDAGCSPGIISKRAAPGRSSRRRHAPADTAEHASHHIHPGLLRSLCHNVRSGARDGQRTAAECAGRPACGRAEHEGTVVIEGVGHGPRSLATFPQVACRQRDGFPEMTSDPNAATLHQPRHAYAGRAELGNLAYELRTTCACFCFVQP